MASPPDVGLTEYERLRADNIRRNDVILASVRRKADELSAAIKSSESPAVRRCSIRLSQPPPDAQPMPSKRRASPKPTPSRRRAPKHTPSRRRAPKPLPPTPKPLPPTLKPRSTIFSSSLASTILEAVSLSPGAAKLRAEDFDAGKELVLVPANVRRLLPSRLVGLLVLPLVDRTVAAAGNTVGNIGFWHADPEPGVVEANGVLEYLPHRGPVAEIVAHPRVSHKIYSCSHGGEICLMDLEKENFNIIHSCDYPVHSLCQAPDSVSCLYFGGGFGKLKLFDERMGKVSTTWDAHSYPINSIDFHPQKRHTLATSSKDGTTRIWDLRSLKKTKKDCLKVLKHDHSVQSAYFSPSGRMPATTSLDNTVRVFDGDDFDSLHIIKHNNQTGRWISTFKGWTRLSKDRRRAAAAAHHLSRHGCRAIWGWSDADLFIGNMERAIDLISVGISDGGLSAASNSACLESEHMTTIPCRFSAHPYKVGHLACASSSGVFLWTRA